jgi:hypothetical protein
MTDAPLSPIRLVRRLCSGIQRHQCDGQKQRSGRKIKSRTNFYSRQVSECPVALERLSNGKRTLSADIVSAKSISGVDSR